MSVALRLAALAAILAAGYLLATRAIPWVFARALRVFGVRLRTSPVTEKRLARFRRIKRGYGSFLAIATLFVTSLFLELIVNDRALAIHFDGRTDFPAVSEWVSAAVPFLKVTPFRKRSDFGQLGSSEVDYRLFARWCADPALLRAEVGERKGKLAGERAEIEAERARVAGRPALEKRAAARLKGLEKREAEVAFLEKSHAAFAAGRAWVVMPVYPHSPSELRHDLAANPPNKPSLAQGVPLGTDESGRDVLALMLYGFRISLAFALMVASAGYSVGIIVGAMQGYYGGWTDIFTQRVEEIWASIPFLFTIMIIASLVQPSFGLLVALLVVLRSWLGITFYIRGEFYREKAKDYVQAAIGCGVSDWRIMTRHILPNALVPVVTFAPFGLVGYIGALVSLDYLGFGLPPGTPSWGSLLRQGLENVRFYPHLVVVPTAALAATLYGVVMIGEAVREAFDPKVFSRLR